jgi:hypothetical protein
MNNKKMDNTKKKIFKLNYTKANGKTKDYLILTPSASFDEGFGGFFAEIFPEYPNGGWASTVDGIRRFNWHRINSLTPLHESARPTETRQNNASDKAVHSRKDVYRQSSPRG